jgi:hypothetical protein
MNEPRLTEFGSLECGNENFAHVIGAMNFLALGQAPPMLGEAWALLNNQ